MAKAKKALSMLLVVLMAMFTFMSYVPAKAASILPEVKFVGLENIPAAVGEEQTLMLTSNYTGDVQYRVFYLQRDDASKKQVEGWKALGDWTPAADAKTPVEVKVPAGTITKAGNYSFAVRVKIAGTEGTYSNNYGGYDSAYAFNYVFAAEATEGLKAAKLEKNEVVAGEKFVISGLKAGESYRLFTLNENRAQRWDKDPVATSVTDKIEWAPAEAGNYVLDLQIMKDGKVDAVKLFNVKVAPKPAELKVESVSSISNTKVKVALSEATTVADSSMFVIADKDSKAVEVKSVSLSSDGEELVVTTAPMTAGELYTFTSGKIVKKFVAKPASTAKLQVVSAMARNNVEVRVNFSADVDETALVASNYSIDNGLTVIDVAKGSSAKEVVLTTSAQTAGKLYKVTVSNVVDLNENKLDSEKSIAYFGGKAADKKAPIITAAAATNSRFKLTITDDSDLDEATVLNKANYVVEGLDVISVAYDKDADGEDVKNVVVVTTAPQTAGKLYKVTINNIADKFANVIKADTVVYFGGRAADKKAPTAAAASLSNTSVNVTFSDDSEIDKVSAEVIENYTIEGLKVLSAELNGKTVTLKTEPQTAGKLYKVTINNVKDEYSNVIKADTVVYFGGKAKDTNAPTYTALSVDNTTVKVVFTSKIDKATVVSYNFYVNELGYALSAKLESDNTTVTLKTLPQTSGKIYTVEARDVANTDGTLVKTDSKATFAGKGIATAAAPKLLAATAIDNKTVLLSFDQKLAVPGTVAIQLENGTVYDATNVSFSNTEKTELVATLSTKTLAEGLYKAVVTGTIGANGVAIASDNNALFGGIADAPTAPAILAATAVDNNTVKIFFDKAIALDSTFANNSVELWNTESAPAKLATLQNRALSTDGKELTLYFRNGSLTLTEGAIYEVRFNDAAKIATKSGKVQLKNDDNKSYAAVRFGAVADTVSGPAVLALIPQSKYVVDINFDRPVAIQGDIKDKLVLQGTNMPVVAKAEVVDDTKIRLYLDETGKTALEEGNVYLVRYTPDSTNYISDAVDTAVKVDLSGNSYVDYQFAALGNVAEGPAVSAVTNVNSNTINVDLDQESFAPVAADQIVVKEGSNPIPTADYVVVAGADNSSFKVVRTNGVFEAGKSYSISLLSGIKDPSGLRTSNTTVVTTFGGIATANLKVTTATVDGANTKLTIDTFKSLSDSTVLTKTLRVRDLTTDSVVVPEVANITEESTITITGATTGKWIVESTDGTVQIIVVK